MHPTHIEPLLCPHLFDQEHLWYAKLDPHMRNGLAVDEVLLQSDVPPHGFHHAEAHCVKMFSDADHRKLVCHRPSMRL